MSESQDEQAPHGTGADVDDEAERREIAEVQDELDSRAEGDGLAAEAGAGEEMGLSEG